MASNQPHTKRDVGGQGEKDNKPQGKAPVPSQDKKGNTPAKPSTKPT